MIKELFKDKQELEGMPTILQELLENPETLNKLNDILTSFNLSAEQEANFVKIILTLFKGEVDLYNLSSVISDELYIDFNEAIDINDRIYEKLLAPVEDDITAQYAAHQASNPQEQPTVNEEDIKEAEKGEKKEGTLIDKAIAKFNLQFEKSELKKRFVDISQSFLDEARTKGQYKNTLKKPVKSGGLGYDKEMAEAIAGFFASYMRIQELEKKKEKEKEIPQNKRVKSLDISSSVIASPNVEAPVIASPYSGAAISSPSVIPVPQQSTEQVPARILIKKDEIDFKSEEAEAESFKQKVEEMQGSASDAPALESKKDTALQEINIKFPSAELNEQLKALVDSRLRNVRTSSQTFERLTMDISQGGLGLSKEEADKVSLILNKYLKGGDLYKGKIKEVKDFEAKVKEAKKERDEREQKRIEKGQEEKFQKLTAGRKVKKIRKKEINKTEKSSPAPSISSHPLQSSRIKPVAAVGESLTLAPKPVLEDISYKPKLYGPVEEIANMTLEDFRRIAKDPKEAVLKIKDKLSLLREESFIKYQAGINAWKKSPLYKEYIDLLNQSLISGKSLEEGLALSKSLNKEEFNAIIESKIGD